MNWLISTSSGEQAPGQPPCDSGSWNLEYGLRTYELDHVHGLPARIMALSSWRMEILFQDSRIQIPQGSGLAKMPLSKYPSFQTASPKLYFKS
eukprot:5091148-Prymnesium_polylepis.1